MSLVIYGRSVPFCPFCEQAKKLAKSADLPFEYKDLTKGEWDVQSLESTLGRSITTIPIIFKDGEFVGGAAELSKLIRQTHATN